MVDKLHLIRRKLEDRGEDRGCGTDSLDLNSLATDMVSLTTFSTGPKTTPSAVNKGRLRPVESRLKFPLVQPFPYHRKRRELVQILLPHCTVSHLWTLHYTQFGYMLP